MFHLGLIMLPLTSTDGSGKFFTNGRHVAYTVERDARQNKQGNILEAFLGHCTPASSEVIAFVAKGEESDHHQATAMA